MNPPRASGIRVLAAVFLTLSACTTTWSRPTTSVADFNSDNNACRHMNTRTVFISPGLTRDYVAPDGYKRCMEEEGYTDGGPWQGRAGWTHE